MIDAVSSYGFSQAGTPAQNRDALHNAIADAAGSEVYIPEGIYLTDPIAITVPGTHLRLASGVTLRVTDNPRLHPSIINITASNVTIEGGQFDGAGRIGVSGVMAIRIQGSVNNIVIRNCVVRDASTGIGAYNAVDCGNWLIENCTIDTTTKSHGIYLHGHPANNSSVTGVRVLNNTIRNTKGNGIWIGNDFNDVVVGGNLILASGRMGIEVWNNDLGRFAIANNIIRECAHFGISISGTNDTTCTANIVDRATSQGIEIAGSSQVTLLGNDIDMVLGQEGGVKPTGIALNVQRLNAASNISIQGGTIVGCTAAINLCGDAGDRSNISIVGVVIAVCTFGIRNVGSIGARDGGSQVDDFSIVGCSIDTTDVCIGNSLYGGLMRGGVISGNNLRSFSGNGIDMFRPAEMLITGNRIVGEDLADSVGICLRDHAGGTARAHDIVVSNNQILHFGKPTVINPALAKTTTVT